MTAFSYNVGVPAAPNNPSVDQPNMLQNTISINGILEVDHVGFNSTGPAATSGGQHLQVSFNGKNVPGALPTDPLSILYTNVGKASTISQMFFANQSGTFPVNAIRAFGSFVTTNSPAVPAFLNQFNVNVGAVTRPPGSYIIPLVTNAVASDNVVVFITNSNGAATNSYSFAGGILTIVSAAAAGTQTINFLVIQI